MTPPQKPTVQNTRQQQTTGNLADMIAKILDTAFSIPGTTIRIGLDPLLGLLPGIGDYLSNLIGSSILFLASRSGVPRIVIFRMASNIFLNMVIGAIPGIGDLFSFWFKSNIRNAQLLHRYSQVHPPASTVADWIYVILLFTAILFIMTILFLAMAWLLSNIWQFLTS